MSEPAPTRRSGLRKLSTDYDGQGPSLAAGTFVANRYRIVRRLGTGGMGAVYEAEQVAIGRRVALKVLRPELAADESSAERFRREARAASLIRSPHVVVVHDFGGGDEHAPLFLVMELLAGESLEARLARERMIEPRAAVAIAREIAQALAAAHAAGVVHRDLKPANVVVAPDHALKVVDFGIARVLETAHEPGGNKMTQAGTLLGTPAYMSPEACLRRPVGPAADLYALGIILFEMLTGKLPLEDEEPILLLGLHARVPPPRLRDERPDLRVPDALEDLVDGLLAKKPEDRPASATEVIARLDALDWSEPATPRAHPPAQTAIVGQAPTGGVRKLTLPIGAALVALVVVGGAIIGAIAYSARNDGPSAPAPLAQPVAVAPVAPAAPEAAPPETAEPAVGPAVAPPVATDAPIRLTIDVTPRDALLTVDGEPASAGVLEVPADGRVLELRASAPGHQERTATVRADQDRHVSLELLRTPRAGRAKRAVQIRRHAAGATGATASPTGQTSRAASRAGRLSDWD